MKKTMLVSIVCALLAAVMCISLTSCVGVSAAELSAGYARTATDTVTEGDDIHSALTDFAFRIFAKTFDKDGGNSLISPYSIAMCLGMLTEGADGETRRELEGLLGMQSDELSRSLYALSTRIAGNDSPLSVADSAWLRQGFPVKSDFLQRNADWYGADVFAAPFDDSTVKDINLWCKKNTDGMIENIIDSIEDGALLYLVNAICFDAEWAEKYEKNDIKDDIFHNRDGSDAEVKMLHSENEKYLSSDLFRGFAKDYKGGRFSFVGLLPRDESKDIFEAARTLDGASWLEMWKSATGGASAGIPEFSFEYSLALDGALRDLGVISAFEEEKADFSRISDSPTYCMGVGHKTFIKLDRNGTRAAAVTWAINGAESISIRENKKVILDRPFIGMIVDNASGIPIFIGVITDLK